MCGIYGVAGLMNRQQTFMDVAAILNESRGADSTGIGRVDANGKQMVYKSTANAARFIRYKKYQRFVGKPARVMIGHCRWATEGDIVRENAHPFKMGETVGTHNGTVKNIKQLRKITGKKYPVDSQYLVHLIDTVGHIEQAYGTTNMAYHRKGDAADLRLIKNGKPLTVALDKDWRWLAYSSETETLESALCVAGEHDYELWTVQNQHRLSVFLNEQGMVDDIQEEGINFERIESPTKPYKYTYGVGRDSKAYERWWEESKYDVTDEDDIFADSDAEIIKGYQCFSCHTDGPLELKDNFVRCDICHAEFHVDEYIRGYGELNA